MNVREINEALLAGNLNVRGLFPHIEDLKQSEYIFEVDFGLKKLPLEPGIVFLRGARQYGKSTWIEQQLRKTIKQFGAGSALYLNGDEILSAVELRELLRQTASSLNPQRKVNRIFVDEITAIPDWERAVKRAADAGELRNVLVVTTGSKASDLRHGIERLPGRKGRLARTTWFFTPISFKEFKKVCGSALGNNTLASYIVSGGCPVAASQIASSGRLPEFISEMIRDWIFGECARAGRSRSSLLAVYDSLFRFGGTQIGQAKIARETGMSNNTIAAGYVDLLHDLMCISTSCPWDHSKNIVLRRKPAKFHFVNLLSAICFCSNHIRSARDFNQLTAEEKGKWYEWAVAQELWRRAVISNDETPDEMRFWRSKEHEIDFVAKNNAFYEVKLGKASALDFSWFHSVFPSKNLTVICATPFTSRNVKGISLEDFLAEC